MTRDAVIERLGAFLDASKDKPAIWGSDDCCTWAAQWVADLTGRDIAVPAYSTEAEAVALRTAAGGLVPMFEQALAGFLRIDYGDVGDVGIIDTHRFGHIGVIIGRGCVFWRAEKGVHMLNPRRLEACWRVVA